MRIWKRALPLAAVLVPLWVLASPVNVNTADAEAISEALKGVGLSKAQAIVDYRQKHGPFKSAEDLSLVKGIGERTVELNHDDILVGPEKKK